MNTGNHIVTPYGSDLPGVESRMKRFRVTFGDKSVVLKALWKGEAEAIARCRLGWFTKFEVEEVV